MQFGISDNNMAFGFELLSTFGMEIRNISCLLQARDNQTCSKAAFYYCLVFHGLEDLWVNKQYYFCF